MERITGAQQQPPVDTEAHGMDFPLYVYKPRRGMKRGEDSKDTYKLPHRLIEKKRRDRINECIAQLKDLLPEHLKLTTLGHLEKAVVLELTLKHVKTLSSLIEQQQQKLITLQNGRHISEQVGDGESSEEMFRSGFHLCAKELLQYLSTQGSSRDLTPSHMISHIQKIAAEVLQAGPASPDPDHDPDHDHAPHNVQEELEKPAGQPGATSEGRGRNCVPVIQRTHPHGAGEQSGSDTDTDSGYGGEHEKRDPKTQRPGEAELKYPLSERATGAIKQEGFEPQAKRLRSDSSGDEALSGQLGGGPGSYMSFSPNQPPFCLPFYLLPPGPTPTAAYLPMLEKCWYPGSLSVMYPGMSGSTGSLPHETLLSPRAGSPLPQQTSMDSPALLQALKQVPPLNLETKD